MSTSTFTSSSPLVRMGRKSMSPRAAPAHTRRRCAAARRSVVRMAVEHVSRGFSPAGEYCGNGAKAGVRLDVYVMRHGRPLRRLERLLDSVPCGSVLTSESALVNRLVPDLVLGGP